MREIEKGEKIRVRKHFCQNHGTLVSYHISYDIIFFNFIFYDIRVFKYLIFFHHNNPIMGFTFHQLH